MNKHFSAVSLFSGAGGMDVGFEDAGYNVVLANDIDPAACATYDLNHKINSICGDLRNHRSEISKYKGVDLIFGGPPCQGFSVAGKMDPDDERSELIWSYLDKVELLKPSAFVCENVKALAVNNRWARVRNGLIERSNELGYVTALIILKASNFGVPQARERMFLVGVKRTRKKVTDELFQTALYSCLEKKKVAPPTISTVIKSLGPAGSKGNERVCSAIITYAKNPVLRKSPYAGMLFNGAGRPINPNGVALTLPASMGGNKTPIVDEDEIFLGLSSYVEKYHADLLGGARVRSGVAPKRLRRITIDEALAIQTFPATYKLSGSQSAMYRQIGNAVPCDLAKAIAESVNEILSTDIHSFTAKYTT